MVIVINVLSCTAETAIMQDRNDKSRYHFSPVTEKVRDRNSLYSFLLDDESFCWCYPLFIHFLDCDQTVDYFLLCKLFTVT